MALTEVDRATLWQRASSRCAICTDTVVREVGPRNDVKVGREHQIRRGGGIALTSKFLDSYDNYVLLCTVDSDLAYERPDAFPSSVMEDLKRGQEASAARIVDREGRITLRLHTAIFMPSSLPYYFLKIRNESSEPVGLERVWFETAPVVAVDNPQRPLPTVVAAGDLFETWIAVADAPRTWSGW